MEDNAGFEDSQKRQEIRRKYREIAEKAVDCIKDPEVEKVNNLLANMSELYDEVQHPREAALDSSLMVSLVTSSYRTLSEISHDAVNFDANVFVEKLLQRGTAIEDSSLLSILRNALTTPSLINCSEMLNCVNPVQRKRRETQKADIDQMKNVTRISLGDTVEEGREQVLGSLFTEIEEKSILGERIQPVQLDQFVVEDDFAKTVEKAFNCSFLARDGNISIPYQNGKYCIMPKPEEDLDTTDKRSSQQIVMRISMDKKGLNVRVCDERLRDQA